jgi:C4-type Zn-finger protein
VAFVCPACSRQGSLKIVRSIELPPDSRSDEITLQIVQCSDCGFAGIAVYEESRRGPLDSESFHHTGYHVSKSQLGDLRKAMRSCPQPGNARCQCRAHQTLGKTDASGRWGGLHDLGSAASFALLRA